jgi:hypothetical protein
MVLLQENCQVSNDSFGESVGKQPLLLRRDVLAERLHNLIERSEG